ncbi:hypothetical protein A2870_00050 [Candidatus Curtissbacteria bacterium RIFCSPHIGHO2_01_FULL_41_11]|uniref:Uncharacterized protein n=1 Tax=Candidatus Curtissbacteria bacterium RIFCSPHIGHO2_01_FULL_41_11 TaxID=1797711 RepID=A0A1F5G5Z7_9BACT|nr:MAG: hypothetical protein A2870_00050 [Candidatus Curtissbacteria bacterium RIFCSPHIGHO2_01_FULL_41_11]
MTERLPETYLKTFAQLDLESQKAVADYLKGVRDKFTSGGLKAVVDWDLYLSLDNEKVGVSPLFILGLETRVMSQTYKELTGAR